MKTAAWVLGGLMLLGLLAFLASLLRAAWEQRRCNRMSIGERLEEYMKRSKR